MVTVQALLEARPLDVEIRLDQLEFAPERRQFALRPEDASQQRRQPEQRLEGPRRSRLNEIAKRGERIEQEVRIHLGTQRSQLRLGGELANFPFAQLTLVALVGQANRVDAPGDDHRNRLQCREIVREKSSAPHQACDGDHVLRGFAGGHGDDELCGVRRRGLTMRRRMSRLRQRSCLAPFDDRRRQRLVAAAHPPLAPGDRLRRERRCEERAHIREQRRHIVLALGRPGDRGAERAVIRPAQHDRVHEPHDPVPENRKQQDRRDP